MKTTRLLGIIFNKATDNFPLSSSLTDVCIKENIILSNAFASIYTYYYQHLTSECMICHVEWNDKQRMSVLPNGEKTSLRKGREKGIDKYF